jgi:hypothetical protein
MPTPTAADFLERAELAEKRAASTRNARMREELLKLAAVWRRLLVNARRPPGRGPSHWLGRK